MNTEHPEIEVRFLEIDKDKLVKKLIELGAEDLGEEHLEEIIFYDKDMKWRDQEKKFIRLRKTGGRFLLAYKHHESDQLEDTEEIEFEVFDMKKAEAFLDRTGFAAYRHQEKIRHKFHLDGNTIDIDTWPRIPTYVELEGPDEKSLRAVAAKLGLDWSNVVLENARSIIENRYHVPVGTMKWFTFDKFE